MAHGKRQRELFSGKAHSFYGAVGAYAASSGSAHSDGGKRVRIAEDTDAEVHPDLWARYAKTKSGPHSSISFGLESKGSKEVKTSLTHPLRVDSFPYEAFPLSGKLGMTISPGKKQKDGWYGNHIRDVDLDLEHLRTVYSTDTIVSLIEEHELKQLKTPHLVEDIKRHGMTAIWYPIEDMGAPTDIVSSMELIELLYEELESGKNVVVHCKGGLGRTGAIVACLLVRVGNEPDNAIAWTRYVRNGAVQTKDQEAFIYRYAFEIGVFS